MLFIASLAALLPFYLIGAFPTGRLIARLKGVDIETSGSGNVGATNVARVVGKKAGAATLLVDVLKGAAGTAAAGYVFGEAPPGLAAWAGLAVVAGHCFSIPRILRGGKGVAAALGVYLYLSPLCACFGVALFAAVFYCFRIVSLASISAALTTPLAAFMLGIAHPVSTVLALIGLLITLRHRGNLERLILGTEKKFKFKTG